MKFQKIKNITRVGLVLLIMAFISACSKSDFLDINIDPNNAAEASNIQLMPAAQGSYAIGFSAMFERCCGTLVQHYINGRFDNYGFDGSSYSNQWGFDIYAGALQDFSVIIDQGTTSEEWHHVGIAKIQTAYIYSILVDMFGDVPFSNALKGAENFNPTVDKGSDIYPQLITMIEDGQRDLTKPATLALGSEDLIYRGNLDNWRKMGNTLKLKMYNQTRLVNPEESKAKINELLGAGDLISSTSENFQFQFTNSVAPEGRHPNFLADYAAGGLENGLASFFINLLVGKNDPRIPYYFYKQSGCSLAGRNGGEGSSPGDDNVRAMHGIYPIGGSYDDGSCQVHNQNLGLQGAGIYPMLTNVMRLFIEAEAALILGTTGDARTLLGEAVNASFSEIVSLANVPMVADSTSNYVNAILNSFDQAADQQAQLQVIMMEKYTALFGNGIESYNDLRRTGFPQNLNVPILQNGPFPLHLPIPPIEVTANENIDPDGDLTTPVFWDVN